MDASEKRARELLAMAYEADGMVGRAGVIRNPTQYMEKPDRRALGCIIAALTPPDGYVPECSVLVAATRIRKLASAATPIARSAYIKAAELIEMAVVAARPDTPDSATVTVASKREAEELSRRRVARIEGAE